jgi:tetratricopeptide (TPR) repeat protein
MVTKWNLQLAQMLIFKGKALMKLGRNMEAQSVFQESAEISPTYISWMCLGLVYYEIGRHNVTAGQSASANFKSALEYFDKAIKLDSNRPDAWEWSGAVAKDLGDDYSAQRFTAKANELKKVS